jgi:hypothetical protein
MRSNPIPVTKADKTAALQDRYKEERNALIEVRQLFHTMAISREDFTEAFFAIIYSSKPMSLEEYRSSDTIREKDLTALLQAFRYGSLNLWEQVDLRMIKKLNQVMKQAQ